jgi:hypothetical protein
VEWILCIRPRNYLRSRQTGFLVIWIVFGDGEDSPKDKLGMGARVHVEMPGCRILSLTDAVN